MTDKVSTVVAPPGCYFYVCKSFHQYLSSVWEVTLYKKRKYWFDKKIARNTVGGNWRSSLSLTAEERIESAMILCLRSYEVQQKDTDLEGYYPPKVLIHSKT